VQLIFYDIAGEVFSNDALAREYAPFLAQAEFILFLFDPLHPHFNILAASQLVDRVYRVTDRDPRKRYLLILSKLDQLRAQDEWAALIDEYWPDAPPTPANLAGYLRDMTAISTLLRDWWQYPARQAANLLHTLPPHTRFCAVSALAG
jgi:hypothetical protein